MSFKIAVVQNSICWEEVESNLNQLSTLLQVVEKDADLIVLPEMFATGFSMNTNKIAQEINGTVVNWLKKKAKETGAAILGTQAIVEDDKVYNRALFVTPQQHIYHYNKRHLFSPGNEDLTYTKGADRVVFRYKGLRILPQICYDLRFPVWSRNRNDYDLAIYMANWPEARQNVWNTLIKARAIENQCYVCAVNRVGLGGGINYVGESQVIDFKGETLLNLGKNRNQVACCSVDIETLGAFKNKFASYNDADNFELVID